MIPAVSPWASAHPTSTTPVTFFPTSTALTLRGTEASPGAPLHPVTTVAAVEKDCEGGTEKPGEDGRAAALRCLGDSLPLMCSHARWGASRLSCTPCCSAREMTREGLEAEPGM